MTTLETLTSSATEAIVAAHAAEMNAYLSGDVAANTWRPEEYAKRVLAAIGLDDLDAAVERADAANWAKDLYEHTGEESKAAMRDALLAALTVAPEKSDRGSIRACSCGGPETCAIPNDCQRRPR